MKKISTLLICSFLMLQSSAQVIGGLQDKLFDYFLLGRYAECYSKSIKMTESDKYKYDPEPFLYTSMCLLKSVDDPLEEDMRTSNLKYAIKYAEKSQKLHAKAYKKEISTFPMEDNLEYFDELIFTGQSEAKYYFNEDKFSKAAYWFKASAKLAPKDDNLQFAKASCMLLSRNMEGQRIMNVLLPRMKEKYGSGDAVPNENTRDALVIGFMGYSKYLKQSGETTKAKDIVKFGHELMPDNPKITALYNGYFN